jgi:hypothetical protein
MDTEGDYRGQYKLSGGTGRMRRWEHEQGRDRQKERSHQLLDSVQGPVKTPRGTFDRGK